MSGLKKIKREVGQFSTFAIVIYGLILSLNCCCLFWRFDSDGEIYADTFYCKSCDRYFRGHGNQMDSCQICGGTFSSPLLNTLKTKDDYCDRCERYEPSPDLDFEENKQCTVCSQDVTGFYYVTVIRLIGTNCVAIVFFLAVHYIARLAVRTRLHKAAKAGDLREVRKQIRNGIAVDVLNVDYHTPLYLAAQAGHTKVAKFLLEAGADPNVTSELSDSPFAVAMQFDREKTALALLEGGGEVETKVPFSGTALTCALNNNMKALAIALIKKDAKLITTYLEGPPLHSAVKQGWTDVAELLIERGADVNEINDDETALDIAEKARRSGLAMNLKQHGAKTVAELEALDRSRWDD